MGTYVENRVEGSIKQYYEDGTLKASGQYEHWRKKAGIWKYYTKDGMLKNTIDYN